MNREHSEVKDKLYENYLHISLHRCGGSGGKKNRERVFFIAKLINVCHLRAHRTGKLHRYCCFCTHRGISSKC